MTVRRLLKKAGLNLELGFAVVWEQCREVVFVHVGPDAFESVVEPLEGIGTDHGVALEHGVEHGVDQAHRGILRYEISQIRKKISFSFGVYELNMYLCITYIFVAVKLQNFTDMTKPPLVKVEAFSYVLQHVTQEKNVKKGVLEY